MRMYVVYLPGGNLVGVLAERVELFSNKITFHRNGERIAFFNLDNICGWWERKECEEEWKMENERKEE